jgi:hypothetical protein
VLFCLTGLPSCSLHSQWWSCFLPCSHMSVHACLMSSIRSMAAALVVVRLLWSWGTALDQGANSALLFFGCLAAICAKCLAYMRAVHVPCIRRCPVEADDPLILLSYLPSPSPGGVSSLVPLHVPRVTSCLLCFIHFPAARNPSAFSSCFWLVSL